MGEFADKFKLWVEGMNDAVHAHSEPDREAAKIKIRDGVKFAGCIPLDNDDNQAKETWDAFEEMLRLEKEDWAKNHKGSR